MTIELAGEIKALIDGANFAHLATIMPDGSPVVSNNTNVRKNPRPPQRFG